LKAPEWTFEPEQLEDALTDKTRAVLINTPANPSGKVFGLNELEVIADFCKAHDLLAITDEIYEYMVFDEHRHISIATLSGMWERTVTISGFSKTFAITGWRLGYAAGPEHLMGPIGLVNDLFYICPPTPLQHGLARGMEILEDRYYEEMSEKYRRNRDLFCEALKVGGFEPSVPQGAYYILADISRLGCETSKEGAMMLLEKAGVASIPGDAFFASRGGRNLVRFCVAQPLSIIEEAAERIATYG
jgi:aminotransferase